MNFIKPLAAALIVGCTLNIAMASNWCGYNSNATISSSHSTSQHINSNFSNAAFANRAKALTNAANNCVPGSKVSTALSGMAANCAAINTPPTALGTAPLMNFSNTKTKKCLTDYATLTQANPAFLSAYKYPADYQTSSIATGPFCDNGTNPSNKKDYTNDPLCQCISAFGFANNSNPIGSKDMRGHAPFSWITADDIAVYKGKARTWLNHVLSLGSNPNNYQVYNGEVTSIPPAQCCAHVGGTVSGDGLHCN